MNATAQTTSRLTPHFWQSPFPIAAATMVTSQAIIYSMAFAEGKVLPFELLWPLSIASILVMVAGLWPDWNYVAIDKDHLEQHAGLSCFRIPWHAIKTITPTLSGVDVRYVQIDGAGQPKLARVQVFNRYGVPVSDLHEMIDRAWHENTAESFGE